MSANSPLLRMHHTDPAAVAVCDRGANASVTTSNSIVHADDWYHYARQKAGRAFGGQLAAHCVQACTPLTRSGWMCNSLHMVFMRPGAMVETRYEVSILRRGRSITIFEVIALEGKEETRQLVKAIVSFHNVAAEEAGVAPLLALPMPAAPPVDDCLPSPPGWWPELRPVDRRGSMYWVRWEQQEELATGPASSWERAAALAFLSDMQFSLTPLRALVDPAHFAHAGLVQLMPTETSTGDFAKLGGRQTASLDHAVHFHSDSWTLSEWLLFKMEARWAGAGRAHVTGHIWSERGVLLASVAQDALLRMGPEFDKWRSRL